MKEIVFCDADGTMLDSQKNVLPSTVYAIHELLKNNIRFVVVSARSPSGIDIIFNQIHVRCPMICYGGSLIMDENRTLLHYDGLSKQEGCKIIEFIEEEHLDCLWNIYSMDIWLVKDRFNEIIKKEEKVVASKAVEGKSQDLNETDIIGKILLICNPDKIYEIENVIRIAFPLLSISKSSEVTLEIMKRGISKSSAIKILCEQWNVALKDTIAFGDHFNDIEMLETVGEPILMGNAPEELKRRFSCITNSNDEDGIYHYLVKKGIISECF